ncbi:QcrA and Rieske domain-containing protein [Amycolatopsis sp. H20-H5]|uniref:QcrA and Rieske domain-containing protein n=1 Tax=Amycolatopsis sp. H20-H5 TaxID=3046309 RepID=UPI002DB8DDAC|nr:Rieske (2Fe-2S) protein [Amycolatopsis sp. H20-H5]MEC3980976.1 Rieske (2Fe-2S) protein [Amycolatopsis sp. H20-H5]
MTAEPLSRRTVLTTGAAVAGAAVGAVALTACGSSAGTPSGGQAGAPAASPGQPLTALADIQVGQAKAAKTADGKDVIVARTAETTVAAFSAICTHQGCTVAPQGAELHCPCHGSVFDALTGAVKKGPASSPLPAVAVKVDNGQVVTS